MRVIAYLHTHWDREWYRTFEEFRLRFINVFDDIVEKLQRDEFSQFYLDGQTVLIEDLLEICPEKQSIIRELIAQKRLVIGPWYTLADEFLVNGESLIRNLLIGMEQAKSYGVSDFLGYLPDAFGHTQSMPQILNSFGIKNALLWRGAGDKPSEFVWQSKDGSKVCCTHLIEGYFQDYLSTNNLKGVVSFLDKVNKKNIGDVILLPIGADHLGAENKLSQKISALNEITDYEIEVSSVFNYLNTVSANLEKHQGELRDNSCNFILPGTYSTRNYLKRENALISWELRKIEAFLTWCTAQKLIPSQKSFIDYIWKMLLKNHAHDSICGCSKDEVHQEMEFRNKKIYQLLKALEQKALARIEGDKLFVFNSSSFAYSGVVEFQSDEKLSKDDGFFVVKADFGFSHDILQDIHKVPVAEDMREIYTYQAFVQNVPALYFGVVQPVVPSGLSAKKYEIENEFLRVQIEQDGEINIFDKLTQKEYKGQHILEDRVDEGDSYNFSPLLNDKPIRAYLEGVKVVESKLCSVLELEYILKDTLIKTQIILKAKSPLLEFRTEWQNKDSNHLLQVKFKLNEPVNSTVSEDALGVVERSFDPNYNLQNQKRAEGFCELKTNTAPMQRFVWAQGMGVFTKGIQEYEVAKDELKLTLLRAVGMLSKTKMHTRSIYAGPPVELPEAQCKRELTCEYAISFCGKDELMKIADWYYNPVVATLGDGEYDNIRFDNPNVYLVAMKESQKNKGTVLRCLNLSSEIQKLNLNAIEVSSSEEQIHHSRLCCECSLESFSLKTLYLE